MTSAPRAAAALLSLFSLAACYTPPPASHSHASTAAMTACRQRADEVYIRQNRGEIYNADRFATAERDSPFASSGLPGITTNGLGGRYNYEQLQDDCLSSTGSAAPNGTTTDAPAHAPPPISAPTVR